MRTRDTLFEAQTSSSVSDPRTVAAYTDDAPARHHSSNSTAPWERPQTRGGCPAYGTAAPRRTAPSLTNTVAAFCRF